MTIVRVENKISEVNLVTVRAGFMNFSTLNLSERVQYYKFL